jgi:hypothetical protein
MLPMQRLYGQTPFVTVPNAHCQPCVGCTKNCYDFNPRVAWLADLHDEDPHWTGYRLFFTGAFLGIVIAYFTLPLDLPKWERPVWFLVAVILGVGSFYVLHTFLKVSVISSRRSTRLPRSQSSIGMHRQRWLRRYSMMQTIGRFGCCEGWCGRSLCCSCGGRGAKKPSSLTEFWD